MRKLSDSPRVEKANDDLYQDNVIHKKKKNGLDDHKKLVDSFIK